MKFSLRLIFLFVAITAISLQVSAQRKKYTQSFDEGMFVADLHTSMGLYRSKQFLTSRLPVFAGLEYGVRSDVGIGAFFGWNQRQFKDPGAPAYDVNYYYVGGKASLHLTRWLNKKFMVKFNPHAVDTYINIWAARQIASQVTFSSTGIDNQGSVNLLGGLLGVKMYTNYNVGFMVEAGVGPYALLNLGICGKF
jgi:hypothetical protein